MFNFILFINRVFRDTKSVRQTKKKKKKIKQEKHCIKPTQDVYYEQGKTKHLYATFLLKQNIHLPLLFSTIQIDLTAQIFFHFLSFRSFVRYVCFVLVICCCLFFSLSCACFLHWKWRIVGAFAINQNGTLLRWNPHRFHIDLICSHSVEGKIVNLI